MTKIDAMVITLKPTKAEQEIIDIAKKLTDPQLYAIRNALCEGEEYRQKEGGKRLSPIRCTIQTGYRGVVTRNTTHSLSKKGLVRSHRYYWCLTPLGVKVGHHVIKEWLDETDIEIDDAPGITYKPTSVTEYVAYYLGLREAESKQRRDEVAEAKRLWKGIRINHWRGRRAMTSVIEEEFKNEESMRASIDLSIHDLIDLGRQIEARRG